MSAGRMAGGALHWPMNEGRDMSEIHYREWHQAATTACGLSAGIVSETGRWSLSWPVVTCGACLNQRARDRYWTHGCGADVLKTTEALVLADRARAQAAHARFIREAGRIQDERAAAREAGSVEEMLKRVRREEAQALADISIAARKLAHAVKVRERLEAMRSPLSGPGSAEQAPAGGSDGNAAEQRSAALSALASRLTPDARCALAATRPEPRALLTPRGPSPAPAVHRELLDNGLITNASRLTSRGAVLAAELRWDETRQLSESLRRGQWPLA